MHEISNELAKSMETGLLIFFIGLVVGGASWVLIITLLTLAQENQQEKRRSDEIFLGPNVCKFPENSGYFPDKQH
jgi:hypothetical protein